MTDFRNLRPSHDLRSQLGLKNSGMTDERRISLGLPPLNEQNQESLRAEIADALRLDVKPLSPDQATPDPLHKIIAVTGCTNQAQARRIHKWFEGQNNAVVNVTNNESPYQDKDASEIVDSIRKMIDGPGYHIGGLTSGPTPIDLLSAAPTHRALSKIHDHVESLESDILELLVMAGANPHTNRRRLDAARTQFELAFMMLKKAVDPEQERE